MVTIMARKFHYLPVLLIFIYLTCLLLRFMDFPSNSISNVKYWWREKETQIKLYKRGSSTVAKPEVKTTVPNRLPVTSKTTMLNNYDEQIEYFKLYWKKQHDMRTNYEKIVAPCKQHMEWHSYNEDRTPYKITSANNSFVTLDIQPAGQYSRFIIETYSLLKTEKEVGGDTWRIHIYGKTSVPVTLVDNQDGSYEASFLIIEAGTYYADIYLDYTLCDGFKNPPKTWFIKGNSQGKFQPPDALPGYEKPFLEEKYRDIYFEVRKGKEIIYKDLESQLTRIYPIAPCYLWDGFGYWDSKNQWTPYIKEPLIKSSNVKRENGKGALWIYGDSIGDLFYRANLKKPLCTKVFKQCNRTYNWVYNLKDINIPRAKIDQDDKDFSIERLNDELKLALNNKSLDKNSLFLLNYGLHYAQEIPYETFIEMIDRVIATIKHEQREHTFDAQIIWRTTTALQKWKWGNPNTNARHNIVNRFLTTARVELFNALSTSKICAAGFKILDVFPLTFSYPNGTGYKDKKWDAVHYDSSVFQSMEKFLATYVHNDNRTPKDLIL